MSTVKKAISFRKLRDKITIIAARAFDTPREVFAEELMMLVNRIDTDDGGHMSRETGVLGLDDAHKMPSREYWRYYFAAAMVPVALMEYQVGGRPMALLCREHAEALLDELQGDEATETQLLELEIDRLKIELGNAERELVAERDRLREVLKEAVAWIEDDRFDDDYISEEWYHAAIKALEAEG